MRQMRSNDKDHLDRLGYSETLLDTRLHDFDKDAAGRKINE